MAIKSLFLAALASSAAAEKLWVSSYAPNSGPKGAVNTLEFEFGYKHGRHHVHASKANASLTSIFLNQQCGSAPTWLDTTTSHKRIYCLDEGFVGNASLNTLDLHDDGSLTRIAEIDTITGPVASQFYNNNTAVALAHYSGSSISNFKLHENGSFTRLQNWTFHTPPGPRPEQDSSHVHEAVIDPTGQYIVFPDLGADLVRVYSIDPSTSLLTARDPLHSKPGYGPRHAAFWIPEHSNTTYMFLIHELANVVISYQVNYAPTGLTFTQIQEIGMYGNRTQPDGTRAAEITVSPDNRFVVGSNRNASIFTMSNPDPTNKTMILSDSLTVFKPSKDGKLTFVQLAPCGGSFPRHFSFNKDGSYISVGNQNSQTADIFTRNIKTGMIGGRIASAYGLPGQVTNVRWQDTLGSKEVHDGCDD